LRSSGKGAKGTQNNNSGKESHSDQEPLNIVLQYDGTWCFYGEKKEIHVPGLPNVPPVQTHNDNAGGNNDNAEGNNENQNAGENVVEAENLDFIPKKIMQCHPETWSKFEDQIHDFGSVQSVLNEIPGPSKESNLLKGGSRGKSDGKSEDADEAAAESDSDPKPEDEDDKTEDSDGGNQADINKDELEMLDLNLGYFSKAVEEILQERGVAVAKFSLSKLESANRYLVNTNSNSGKNKGVEDVKEQGGSSQRLLTDSISAHGSGENPQEAGHPPQIAQEGVPKDNPQDNPQEDEDQHGSEHGEHDPPEGQAHPRGGPSHSPGGSASSHSKKKQKHPNTLPPEAAAKKFNHDLSNWKNHLTELSQDIRERRWLTKALDRVHRDTDEFQSNEFLLSRFYQAKKISKWTQAFLGPRGYGWFINRSNNDEDRGGSESWANEDDEQGDRRMLSAAMLSYEEVSKSSSAGVITSSSDVSTSPGVLTSGVSSPTFSSVAESQASMTLNSDHHPEGGADVQGENIEKPLKRRKLTVDSTGSNTGADPADTNANTNNAPPPKRSSVLISEKDMGKDSEKDKARKKGPSADLGMEQSWAKYLDVIDKAKEMFVKNFKNSNCKYTYNSAVLTCGESNKRELSKALSNYVWQCRQYPLTNVESSDLNLFINPRFTEQVVPFIAESEKGGDPRVFDIKSDQYHPHSSHNNPEEAEGGRRRELSEFQYDYHFTDDELAELDEDENSSDNDFYGSLQNQLSGWVDYFSGEAVGTEAQGDYDYDPRQRSDIRIENRIQNRQGYRRSLGDDDEAVDEDDDAYEDGHLIADSTDSLIDAESKMKNYLTRVIGDGDEWHDEDASREFYTGVFADKTEEQLNGAGKANARNSANPLASALIAGQSSHGGPGSSAHGGHGGQHGGSSSPGGQHESNPYSTTRHGSSAQNIWHQSTNPLIAWHACSYTILESIENSNWLFAWTSWSLSWLLWFSGVCVCSLVMLVRSDRWWVIKGKDKIARRNSKLSNYLLK
jgi:hypothetical protein